MSNAYTPLTTTNTRILSDTKLKRILEYNKCLKEQMDLHRIPVSEAANSLVTYCSSIKDPLIPSIWGSVSKEEDPFALAAGGNSSNGCCTII